MKGIILAGGSLKSQHLLHSQNLRLKNNKHQAYLRKSLSGLKAYLRAKKSKSLRKLKLHLLTS